MKMRFVLVLPAVLALAACYDTVPPQEPAPYQPYYSSQADYIRSGTIISVRPVTMQRSTDGDRVAGGLVGGLVGAVIGHQFGEGSGRDVMTGAGAITGAVVGSNIAANQGGTYTSYAWTVRLDNGGTMTVIQQSSSFHVGQRVQVIDRNGQVYLR